MSPEPTLVVPPSGVRSIHMGICSSVAVALQWLLSKLFWTLHYQQHRTEWHLDPSVAVLSHGVAHWWCKRTTHCFDSTAWGTRWWIDQVWLPTLHRFDNVLHRLQWTHLHTTMLRFHWLRLWRNCCKFTWYTSAVGCTSLCPFWLVITDVMWWVKWQLIVHQEPPGDNHRPCGSTNQHPWLYRNT